MVNKVAWYQRIGPGLITACVVIGPGSILTSSQVGAEYGYSMAWVVVTAVFVMLLYMYLAAKLGVVAGRPTGDLITSIAGRPLAVLLGLAVFFISAAFQFGNNLGVHAAIQQYVDWDYGIIVFNLIAILFMFSFRNLYKALERVMSVFVAILLASFCLNLMLAWIKRPPSITEVAAGFVPQIPTAGIADSVPLLGLFGTTFVISAAYYQSYLVQQKGWTIADLKSGQIDARVGSAIMGVITLMIVFTSSAVLRGRELTSITDVASQLEPLFGQWGLGLFCLGLFSAAYSSFLVNSMIGGFILCDGLGLGSDPKAIAPKIATTVVLLTGMVIAMVVLKNSDLRVGPIVFAQATTVLAAPLMAGVILWLTNRRDIMGAQRNGPWTNAAAAIGFVAVMAMALHLAINKVWPQISGWASANS